MFRIEVAHKRSKTCYICHHVTDWPRDGHFRSVCLVVTRDLSVRVLFVSVCSVSQQWPLERMLDISEELRRLLVLSFAVSGAWVYLGV